MHDEEPGRMLSVASQFLLPWLLLLIAVVGQLIPTVGGQDAEIPWALDIVHVAIWVHRLTDNIGVVAHDILEVSLRK